jgi:RNA polymerase sigma factor (sigma-70 family)
VEGDLELLAAWRAGDRAAGDVFVRAHFESICRFFRTKLGDDVEDLIQQTFLDLVSARGPVRNVRATLFTIARRRLLDHLRTRYKHAADSLTSLSVADLGTSPSSAVARHERERLLGEALRRIPLDQQIVLELAYWEELDGPTIAEILEISANTVRSRLSRAREALRTEIMRLAATPAAGRSTMDDFDSRVSI